MRLASQVSPLAHGDRDVPDDGIPPTWGEEQRVPEGQSLRRGVSEFGWFAEAILEHTTSNETTLRLPYHPGMLEYRIRGRHPPEQYKLVQSKEQERNSGYLQDQRGTNLDSTNLSWAKRTDIPMERPRKQYSQATHTSQAIAPTQQTMTLSFRPELHSGTPRESPNADTSARSPHELRERKMDYPALICFPGFTSVNSFTAVAVKPVRRRRYCTIVWLRGRMSQILSATRSRSSQSVEAISAVPR